MLNKKLICGAMVLLTALSWYSVINNKAKSVKEYKELISKAEKLSAKGISVDAAECYSKAIEMDPKNYTLYVKLFDEYSNLNDEHGMEDTFNKGILLKKNDETLYVKKIQYLIGQEDYEEAFDVIDLARKNTKSDAVEQLFASIEGEYNLIYLSAEVIRPFHGEYAAFSSNGAWGIYNEDYSVKLNNKFEDIGAFSKEDEIIPVCFEDEWYYVDTDGNRKRVPDRQYESLGAYSDGLAPASLNGVYGYLDTDCKEKNFEYDYAGVFDDGIAAVRKGGKWAIVNKDLKPVSDYVFDDIKIDENGSCSFNGVFFAKQNGSYAMYNNKGKQIGKETFQDAKVFVSSDAAAVCIGGKWGFVNSKGKIVIDPQYEDAGSFSVGIAPVKKGGKWGFVNESNNPLTEFEFEYAYSANSKGKAPVVTDTGLQVVSFYSYKGSEK